jgi:tetratricopeptide (TPR) repeat protein
LPPAQALLFELFDLVPVENSSGSADRLARFGAVLTGVLKTSDHTLADDGALEFRHGCESSRRAADAALKYEATERAALWQASGALHEAEVGNAGEARRQAERALVLAPGRDVRVLAALALARAGDAPHAQKLADGLNQEFPLDTLMQHYSLPTVRAMLALARGNGRQALELIEATSGYEFGCPQAFANTEPPLYPLYVRGKAYLMAGQVERATAEFQKMIGSRPWNYPLFALARLQLGRAHAMSGDKESARKDYENFFTLWKDAGSDIPILREATREYEKLK